MVPSSASRPISAVGGSGSDGRRSGRPGGHSRRVERGVVGEDRLVELVQLGAWLDPELLDEHLARAPIGLQRVGLAAAAI